MLSHSPLTPSSIAAAISFATSRRQMVRRSRVAAGVRDPRPLGLRSSRSRLPWRVAVPERSRRPPEHPLCRFALSAKGILNARNLTFKCQTTMCFACGGPPSTGVGEHVIPKWLQHKSNLFNERLTLLNGTLVPYRNLTVPCCEACNNGFLSQIENAVQPIIERGTIETPGEKLLLGRWLSKILIGFLVKETSLLLDRKRPDSGPMVPAQFIEDLKHAISYSKARVNPPHSDASTATCLFHCIFTKSLIPEDIKNSTSRQTFSDSP
jgi:hypothetical protein